MSYVLSCLNYHLCFETNCEKAVVSLKNILKDGSAEISNNLCEQRMKPVKLLLKNCMNIGSEDAAGNSAFTFSLEDYPHLAGFQYMKDISLPNYSSSKIADRILEGKILFEKVQKAAQYEEMIKPRLEALVHLKESLDNEFNLYSYMPRMYPFITGIKADYLISSHFSVDNFIFIIKANAQGELKCDFLCCSIFEI